MAAIKEEARSVCGVQPERAYGKIVPFSAGFEFWSDDWYLYEYAQKKSGAAKKIHIGFSGILQPQIKLLIKQYAAWRLGHVKPVTVRMEVSGRLAHFVQYLSDRKITDPAMFSEREFRAFSWRLCQKGITGTSGYRIAHTVSELIRAGQRMGWQVTDERISADVMHWQLWTETAQRSAGGHTMPIPNAVYRQILYHAVYDETDVITKAGILIQSQTGLRISEVLALRENCLVPDKQGGFLLEYSLKKTEKAEPVRRCVPANELVCEAVEELLRATGKLRAKSGREELFLVKNHGIRLVSAENWNRGRLRNFLRRWNIKNADGSEYPLHSHQFRATYVKRQLLNGGSIEAVKQQFGHVSPEMTARYVHLSEGELLAHLTPYIGQGGDEVGEKECAGR